MCSAAVNAGSYRRPAAPCGGTENRSRRSPARVGRALTWMRRSSRNAPPPLRAAYVRSSSGACTTPTTGSPSTTSPTDTPTASRPCTKFDGAVERIDEPTGVGARRRPPPRRTPASPVSRSSTARTASSLAVSAAVTQSPGAFSRTSGGAPKLRAHDLAAGARRAGRRRRGAHRDRGRSRSVAVAGISASASVGGAGRDELPARVGIVGHELFSVRVAHGRARFDAREVTAEVVPRREIRVRSRRDRRARPPRRRTASSDAQPSARNCFHGRRPVGIPRERDHGVLDARDLRRAQRARRRGTHPRPRIALSCARRSPG